MQVNIQNDGPVTISLETPTPKPARQKQVSDLTKHLFTTRNFFLSIQDELTNHELPYAIFPRFLRRDAVVK